MMASQDLLRNSGEKVLFSCHSQGQVQDPVLQILRLSHLCHVVQVLDTSSDRDSQLVSINDTGKPLAAPLTPSGLSDEVSVLREEEPA